MGGWTAWQVIAGLVGGLGIGAFVTAYFAGLLNALLPSPARLAGLIRRRDLPLPAGDRILVLIANLQGDDEHKRTHTRHVVAALVPYRGLDVIPIGPGPEWGIESRDAVEAKARGLLAKRQGDVLIFGEVAEANTRLRLWFLPAHSKVESRYGSYQLQVAELPADFSADFNAVLVALVAASVAPATERQGRCLVDVLEPAAGRLKHLCANLPAGLDADQHASLWHALGLSAYVLGEQKGQRDWLETSVAGFRAALEEASRERVPLRWAIIQSNLGTVLARLGEREQDPQRLQAAVGAYSAALDVWTRERFPLQWAGTQVNLGTALRTLGELEEAIGQGIGRLKQAVAALRAALKVLTREGFPLHWAMAQNNLGSALTRLGEREEGTARLEEAAAAFRAALEVWTRERVPLLWATAWDHLGVALQTLGKRQNSTEHLYESIAAYDHALMERTRKRVRFDWAITQHNRGNALLALGELEPGTEHLEQAVEAYRGALEVFHQGGHQIGMTERNLASAEALLAERRGRSAAE